MSALTWLAENWQTLAITATSVVGGASMIVAAVAPLTKSDKDDRALAVLKKVVSWLEKLALNPPPSK
jgi:hypothetical protein